MTTFTGLIVAGGESDENPNDNPEFHNGRTMPPSSLIGWDSSGLEEGSGSYSELRPHDVRSLAKVGLIQYSYFQDYYNRLYIIPSLLDFGPITGTMTAPFYVWNAYLHSSTISEITLSNAEGVTLDGPSLPAVMKALAILAYTLTVTDEGDPNLVGEVVFDIGEPQTVPLPFRGVRSHLSPFRPNWKSPVTVRYEYRTEIIPTRSGKEQRRALRTTPRKSLDFSVTTRADRLRRFNQLMAVAQARTVVMPEFTTSVRVVAEIGSGSTTLELAAVPYWVVPDARVMLGYGERFESRSVFGVVGNIVTLKSASAEPWPLGTALYPAVAGAVAEDVASVRQTNAVAELSVVFEVTPAAGPLLARSGITPQIFNGREVFMKRPNWGSRPSLNYQWPREDVDYGRGRISRFTPIEFGTRLYRATYTGRTPIEVDDVREFFDRMKGQRGEFYMPTWEDDLPLHLPSPFGSAAIRTQGFDVFNGYRDSTVDKAVAVFMRSGTVYLNRIVNIVSVIDDDGADSLVTVQTPWPEELTPQNVLRVSFMPVWRHATDILAVQWLNTAVAQMQLTMQTLEDLV